MYVYSTQIYCQCDQKSVTTQVPDWCTYIAHKSTRQCNQKSVTTQVPDWCTYIAHKSTRQCDQKSVTTQVPDWCTYKAHKSTCQCDQKSVTTQVPDWCTYIAHKSTHQCDQKSVTTQVPDWCTCIAHKSTRQCAHYGLSPTGVRPYNRISSTPNMASYYWHDTKAHKMSHMQLCGAIPSVRHRYICADDVLNIMNINDIQWNLCLCNDDPSKFGSSLIV